MILTRRPPLNRAVGVLAIVLLASSTFFALIDETSPIVAAQTSTSSLLYDDFTHDTSLNAGLWQINGPVGTAYGPNDVGVSIVTLEPVFSSLGMMINQVNASQEVGTIQSIENFTPPFTANAVVKGTISNGHTWGFALTNANASYGVVVYGNLNSTNCSNLGNCGDPSTCGNSVNSNIPAGQCYYGIDAKAANGTGQWTRVAKLYLTPNVNVDYSIQISVNASGNAQYSVSQGGQLLGESNAQIGTGPFYVILEQGEGAPVAKPGPNEAYWMSVSLSPQATLISTTSKLPSTTPSGISTTDWINIVIIVVVILLLLFFFLWSGRRDLKITVIDSQAPSPVPEASVLADGPENLKGYTEKNGRITFKGVKKGDYTIKASAAGYNPSVPVTIEVKKTTDTP